MRIALQAVVGLMAANIGTSQGEYAKLIAPGGDPSHGYGAQLCIESGFIAVGSPEAMNGHGAVFIYDGLTLVDTLVASDGAPGDYFGARIALDSGKLAVTAKGYGAGTGALYLFDSLSGEEQWRVVGFGGDYGESVAIHGGLVAVGAPNSNGSSGVRVG